MKLRLGKKTIDKNSKPLLIAELSCNHCGSLKTAKKIILTAKAMGADYIKFQTYEAKNMTIKANNKYLKIQKGLWKGKYLWDLYEKAQTPFAWQKELFAYSKKINIEIVGNESDIDMAVKEGHINENKLSEAKRHFNTKLSYSNGYNNMVDLIRGKFPQISITDNEILLRGNNSITGNNGALIVLKGATYNWASAKSMDVTQIKNMTILTGAVALRYGSGSSNGVLLIELVSE